MNYKTTARTTAMVCIFSTMIGMTVLSTGCAVMRGQESAGAYVDDAAITASVKAKMIDDKSVSAASMTVETLKGTVQLSGFAKSFEEKMQAGRIARDTKGVVNVINDIVVRP